MARPLRIEYPGATYHVTARGNERAMIYRDDEDRTRFLAEISRASDRLAWNVLAYCLMGNHYHLVIETPNGNLARGMRDINSIYAQGFNRRHDRVGHLFQGRYRGILVQTDLYFSTLIRYVVRNPVRAGLCATPEEWRWSSHPATLGITQPPDFLRVGQVLAEFGANHEAARDQYRAFVGDSGDDSAWDPLAGRVIHGTPEFERETIALASDRVCAEIPDRQRTSTRPSLTDLLRPGASGEGILEAHRVHGYRLSEIARLLGMHPSTVTRRLRSAESRAAQRSRLTV